MKKRFASLAMLVTVVLALAALGVAQIIGGTIRGKVNDQQGKPIQGAVVVFKDADTGRKYELKTNAKGEYLQVGMSLGTYEATLMVNGQPVMTLHHIKPDPSDETPVDFDLQKETAAALQRQQQQGGAQQGGTAQPGGMAPTTGQQVAPAPQQAAPTGKLTEQQNAAMAQREQENNKIRNLNKMLQDAEAAKTAGNLDQAIALMQQATAQAPDKDLLWIKLAEYDGMAGKYADAIEPFQKAIALTSAEPPEKQNKAVLAQLHNNLGQAYGKTGKAQLAIQEYTAAAAANPTDAAQYYFNLGAMLTNTGHPDDANAAFDKAIAANPNYADAYYQKGVNLLGKATIGKDGKMTAPDGTADALNKYLALQPTGKYAEGAKQLLASIGAEVETGYKTPAKSAKKPK